MCFGEATSFVLIQMLFRSRQASTPQTLERERKRERDGGHCKRIGIETKFPQLELLAVFWKRKQATAVFHEATNSLKLFFLVVSEFYMKVRDSSDLQLRIIIMESSLTQASHE